MGNTSNRVLLSDYLLGQQGSTALGRNYVPNPSAFENINNIAASGTATVARNTTTPLTAISDIAITLPNNATDGVTWTLNTLDNALNSQNCELRFDYTASSIGSVVVAQVLQGGIITAQSSVLPLASTPKTVSLNSPCGTSGTATTIKIINFTGNSGTSALNVANVTYGRATNLTSVAQAGVYGTLIYQAGCSWSFSSSSYTDPSATSGCAVAVTGSVTAPGTILPQAVVNAIPAGTYRVDASFAAYSSSGAGGFSCRLVDDAGTEISSHGAYSGTANNLPPMFISGVITYATAANHTFKVQCKTALSSTSVGIDNTTTENASFQISVYNYPSSSQVAVAAGTGGAYFSGSMSVSSMWSTTSASYVDGTNSGGNALTTIYSSGITVTAAASNVAGITFTPTAGAVYKITAAAAMFSNTTLAGTSIRLTDGTTPIGFQGYLNNSTGLDVAIVGTVEAIYVPGTVSPVTVKLQIASGGGTASIDSSGIEPASLPSIQWTIVQINNPFPAPVIIGANPTTNFYSGYQTFTSGWTTTSNGTFADFSAGGAITINQVAANNITATDAASSLPGILVTLPSTGYYKVTASFSYADGSSESPSLRLVDGSGTIIHPGLQTTVSANSFYAATFTGIYDATSTSVTFKLQGCGQGGTLAIKQSSPSGTVGIQWEIVQIK